MTPLLYRYDLQLECGLSDYIDIHQLVLQFVSRCIEHLYQIDKLFTFNISTANLNAILYCQL